MLFVLLALAGFFVFAAGGIGSFVSPGAGAQDTLMVALLQGNLVDTAIVLISLVLLVWALMPGGAEGGLGRTQLLQGVALGSALVVCGCVTLCLYFEAAVDPRLPGALALVALLQGAVGLMAGLCLFARGESRRSGWTPIFANGGLTALVLVLTHAQNFA